MNNRFNTLRSSSARYSTSTVMDGAARKVLRNTYLLLSLCLGFSAIVAGASIALSLPSPGIIVTLAGYFGLLFLVTKYRDRGLGVGMVFALTGFMGYTLGPIVSQYLSMPNG